MGSDELSKRVAELEAEVRVLHTMLNSAPDFITRITVDGKFLYLNRVAPGFRMEDVLGTSVDAYVPEAFRERSHAAMRAASETRTVQQYATAGRTSPDRIGHYFTRVSPVVEEGEVNSLVMIATDVTELQEQRIQLQVALDASEQGIWTYRPPGDGGSWDDRARRIFGYAANENPPSLEALLEKNIHPEDRAIVAEALERCGVTGHYGPLRHRIVRPNGEVRWVSASGLAVRDHSGTIVGSVQDITERHALEERLLEAQKLESIGRLAGGVAHDFNNMLTAVFGNLDFAEDATSLSEVRPLLDAIRVTAERSAALTAQLLAFARRQVVAPKVLDLNALVRRLDTMFRRAIGEHIRVQLELSSRARVRADESQIEQVVMNLVTNARDAMPEGGALTVETRDVELDQSYADSHPDVVAGAYVLLAVSDTGAGIAAENLPRVFEPFFTTRAGGTGLGLATCYGIVKQSGGHLGVYSAPGKGTTFKVYLPCVEGEPESQRRAGSEVMPGKGEWVLVVEDEAPVRAIIERTLQRRGYRVVGASSAEAALDLVRTQSSFDLLVSDVILPGISGPKLAERLRVQLPSLAVLYVSGYTENAAVHDGSSKSNIRFLQKPFRPQELLRAVRKVLE